MENTQLILVLLSLCFVFSLSFGSVINTPDDYVDFAVIGGGASGTAAAVFLKDKGYSVAIIEKDTQLGGACDTFYFAPDPNENTLPEWWSDLGVTFYTNTTWTNSKGYGNWQLQTDLFVQRFVPRWRIAGFNPADGGFEAPAYVADFNNPIMPGLYNGIFPAGSDSLDINALIQFVTDMQTNYPWLDSVAFPSPIPPELLVPFSTWLAAHPQYESLRNTVFTPLIYLGGLGNWDNLLAVHALLNVRPGLLGTFYFAPPGESGLFTLIGGCQVLYRNILFSYLGDASLGGSAYLNATITSVTRPSAGSEKNADGTIRRSSITVQRRGARNTYQTTIKAKYIMHAVPQTLTLLTDTGMRTSLDSTETNLFAGASVRDYFSAAYYLDGPLATSSTGTKLAVGITNFNLTGGDLLQHSASALQFFRGSPNNGPFQCPCWSPTPITDSDMKKILISQANSLRNMTVNSMTYVANEPASFNRHYFQPYFSQQQLSQQPTPYQTLSSIQGRRNTYWIGAIASFAESAKVWEHAFRLINSNGFPLYK